MLYASRPKIINAFVFILRATFCTLLAPKLWTIFFLRFVLRALCFSSQNYKHIRIYPVRATFPALLAPKLCTNFFFSHSCYVLFASRPKIIKAFVFIPYVLRSLHFSPQNYIFLPFVLRALCFCDFFMYIMRNENILIRIEN